VHVEVHKLVPNANTPRILCEAEITEAGTTVTYQSARKLCAVFTGLLQGMGDHFACDTEYKQLRCMNDGADCCEFTVRFSATESQ
jgi:predicted hydrocarbon binding protein